MPLGDPFVDHRGGIPTQGMVASLTAVSDGELQLRRERCRFARGMDPLNIGFEPWQHIRYVCFMTDYCSHSVCRNGVAVPGLSAGIRHVVCSDISNVMIFQQQSFMKSRVKNPHYKNE